ncbi:MAG: hypothetical protein LBS82_05290, partial [Spirochaetaceae bacterium]|nr:hypothetical protein [Spirochaetaceae bacterium]
MHRRARRPPERRPPSPPLPRLRLRLALSLLSLPLILAGAGEAAVKSSPYQIPQTIYIGDRGLLVYPLDAFFFNQDPRKTESIPIPGDAASARDVVIHSISIERGRLIVDFQPFRTGVVDLPPIVVHGQTVSGLAARVSSILEDSGGSTVLSAAALPLNAPGALWIISALVFAVLLAAALALVFLFHGGSFFVKLKRKLRHRRTIRQMQRSIKGLKTNLDKNNIGAQTALTGITNELRTFMDAYFNIRCRSMVPREFLDIAFPAGLDVGEPYTPRYFHQFFTNCDTIRFSGETVSAASVQDIVGQVERFVAAV